ncbi:MAG: hypothetical protein R3B89_28280 [Polyangiaceae bacterium]
MGEARGAFDAVYDAFGDLRGPEFDHFGTRLGWWAHDRRSESASEWLHRMCRVVRGEQEASDQPLADVDLARALREALRHYNSPARLANTELAARLSANPTQRASALRELLEELVILLDDESANETWARVLREGFMVPGRKQLAAASTLKMSLSTFRRRTAEAIAHGALLLPRLYAQERDGSDRHR